VLCDCGERGRDGMGWEVQQGGGGRKEGRKVRFPFEAAAIGRESGRSACTVPTVLTPFCKPASRRRVGRLFGLREGSVAALSCAMQAP
jgi:hypothetical protein